VPIVVAGRSGNSPDAGCDSMFSDLAQEGIVRPPSEPQAWVASMVVADDVTVGLDADRDPYTGESSLVLHHSSSAVMQADCSD
jgi:hypothetical protein